jgi:hypothetical protein
MDRLPSSTVSSERSLRANLGWRYALLLLCAVALPAEAKVSPPQSFLAFCPGDGSAIACPCGNSGQAGAGCVNASGMGATLDATGNADVVLDTVQLQVSDCPPNTPGIFFGGNYGGSSLPFGNGLLCISSNVIRLGAVFCDPTGSAVSPSGIAARENLHAGDVRYYQFWFRDIIGPCGAAFNTSSGCRVQW